MKTDFDVVWEKCPTPFRQELRRYLEEGLETGGFLRAVLHNNLHEAVFRAGDANLALLHPLCLFVYNELPSGCWGHPITVKKWLGQPRVERERGLSLAEDRTR